MEDTEILARLNHEQEMRMQIAEDLRHHQRAMQEEIKKLRSYDRWRWGVGILLGLVLSRTPDGLEFLQKLVTNT